MDFRLHWCVIFIFLATATCCNINLPCWVIWCRVEKRCLITFPHCSKIAYWFLIFFSFFLAHRLNRSEQLSKLKYSQRCAKTALATVGIASMAPWILSFRILSQNILKMISAWYRQTHNGDTRPRLNGVSAKGPETGSSFSVLLLQPWLLYSQLLEETFCSRLEFPIKKKTYLS